MKLYYNPKSRAAIAKWMLDECGADYEIVPIDFTKREHKTPEFLKINPAGKLPALVDGEVKIFEGAAICLYLGDKFPGGKTRSQNRRAGSNVLKSPHFPFWLFISAATDPDPYWDQVLTLIRHYFEAAQAMSPTAVGNGTQP